MRVAYVCTDPGVPVFGHKGASVHVQAILRVLVRAGTRVELLCARTGGEVPPDLLDVRVHPLPRVSGTDPAEREASAVLSDAAVAPMLTALHSAEPLDLVYERYALWGRSATAWAADSGTPSVLEVNAPLVQEQELHRTLVDRQGAERAAGAAIGSATATIAVTSKVADWARARTRHPERVQVVPNGVDTDRIRPTARSVATPDADPFVIGFVGTLKPWHGVDTLVAAAALLIARDPSYRLLLIGDGPEAQALAAQAARHGITDHVQLTGSVAPARMPTLLGRMDIACAPYPPMDGFYFSPLKVQEYLAAGVPVVASRVGELPTTLAGGKWGSLVEPGDVAALSQAIAGLRADAPRRRRLRILGRAAALSNDWRQVVTTTLTLVGLDLPGARTPEVAHVGR